MKHTLKLAATSIFVAAFFSSSLLAATPSRLNEAELLLSAGRSNEALSLLEENFSQDLATTQELFLLGVSAKQSGLLAMAAEYFQLALQREPNAGRIRLELAETLFRLGRYEQSRAELLTVRGMNPPAPVLSNIERFIASVDAAIASPTQQPRGPQKNWNAYITTGFSSDSNVNAGPNTDTVFLYGLPFTLSAGAQETRDGAWFLRTGYNHQKQVSDRILWRSGAHLSLTDYFSADVYDTTSLSLSTGPSIRLSERSTVSVPISWNVQRYNEQGGWYSQTISVGARYQYSAFENLQLYVDASLSEKRFKENAARKTKSLTFNPSLNYQPSSKGNVAFGFRFGSENSGQDIYSNKVRSVFLGYQHRFEDVGLETSVTGTITETKFEGIQAAYTVAREDLSRQIAMTFSYDLGGDTALGGSISFQDNGSNLDINRYKRTQVSLELTKRF